MDGAVKELGQTEQAQEMIFALSLEQEQHLQEIGYTNQEIAAFQTSAKNDSDVEFLTNLAEGDYENAFKVNPGALSDLCKLQLSNYEAILATRPGTEVYANGQYGYQVNLANPSTLEANLADYSISVEIEQKEGAADVLSNVLINKNAQYKSEINDLDQKAVINTMVSTYDSMVPFPVKDGYEMLVSLDGKLNDSDLLVTSKIAQSGLEIASSDDMQLPFSETLGTIGNGLGIANEVFDGGVLYNKDKLELENKILLNNQTLSMAQSGQMTEMYVTVTEADGDVWFSDKTQIAKNNVLPEVQYNLNRWQEQGIDAYLGDMGIENTAEIKEDLLESLNPKKIALGMNTDDFEVTEEQIADVEKAVDATINGGDFSDLPSDVFQEVQGKINIELENEAKEAGMPMGLNDWVLKRNGVAKEAENTYGLETAEKINWDEFELPKLNLTEPKLVILDLYQDEKIDLGDLMDEGKLVITPEEVDLQIGGSSVTAPKTNVSRNAMTR